MKRREFISLLGGAALSWPISVRAQQATKMYRIGWLQPGPLPDSWVKGFRQGLQDFNYAEGKNLIIDYRWGDGSFDHLSAMAQELVSLNPDVIVSVNTVALQTLQRATTTIPIVMLGTADPVSVGLVRSLAKPGAKHHRHVRHGSGAESKALGTA